MCLSRYQKVYKKKNPANWELPDLLLGLKLLVVQLVNKHSRLPFYMVPPIKVMGNGFDHCGCKFRNFFE
jgi:hypothetical protein